MATTTETVLVTSTHEPSVDIAITTSPPQAENALQGDLNTKNERNGESSKENSDHEENISSPTARNTSTALPKAPSKYDSGWRYIVRNFTPSWFAVTMGTGIVSILLFLIPYAHSGLYYASLVFFGLNTLLFLAALTASTLRYTLYPQIWTVMIRDPSNSLFLATIPMGLATLLQMWIYVCVPHFGEWARRAALGVWILDALLAVACTLGLPMMLMCRDDIKSLDRITAAQLLPIAATVVAAGVGARVAPILRDEGDQLGVVITCYVLWGMSIPFAFMVFCVYYHRLVLHKLPPREVIVSAFLPLGPCGYSANILLLLGRQSVDLLPKVNVPYQTPHAGEILMVGGYLGALFLWGFGLLWFFFALAAIYRSRPFPFNMGWWGFTFPLGVYSAATLQLGEEMGSNGSVFKILGTIFSVSVFLLWIVVAIGTVKGAMTRHLFYAPCLANLKENSDASESDLTVSKAA